MNAHRATRLLLYDHVRGTLDPADAARVEEHLRACRECDREAESHRALLRAVPVPSPRPSDVLPESYWTGFANEVMGRVGSGPVPRPGPIARLLGRRSDPARAPLGVPPLGLRLAVAASAAAVIAVVWFALPDRREGRPGGGIGGNDRNAAGATDVADSRGAADTLTEFDRRLSRYFRTSKALLVGFSNLGDARGGIVDLDAERELSRSLLREARFLRTGPVDARSERLIGDLDRILIALANGDASESDIELIRGGIENGNLLFKLRMQETSEYRLPVRQASHRE